jgi:hypothetical protein
MNEITKFLIELLTILAGSGATTVVVTAIFERRRKKAEARNIEVDYADQISKASMALVDPLKTEVERLTLRVNRLEQTLGRYAQRIAYLMGGIDQLIRQLMGAGKDPCWTPNEWSSYEPSEDKK